MDPFICTALKVKSSEHSQWCCTVQSESAYIWKVTSSRSSFSGHWTAEASTVIHVVDVRNKSLEFHILDTPQQSGSGTVPPLPEFHMVWFHWLITWKKPDHRCCFPLHLGSWSWWLETHKGRYKFWIKLGYLANQRFFFTIICFVIKRLYLAHPAPLLVKMFHCQWSHSHPLLHIKK